MLITYKLGSINVVMLGICKYNFLKQYNIA